MTRSGNDAGNENPLAILGVDPRLSDEELRQRYVTLVRQYPPERNREEFRRIRSAYEALRRPADRARYALQQMAEPPALFPGSPGEPRGPLGISPAWWHMGDPWSELLLDEFGSDCRDPLGK
jgi:curved DNA-binding protein CbpA